VLLKSEKMAGNLHEMIYIYIYIYRVIKNLCSPDDYNTNISVQHGPHSECIDGHLQVINIVGIIRIHCNRQVHRYFLITLCLYIYNISLDST